MTDSKDHRGSIDVDEVDFMSIGSHCAVDSCKQLDFLPVTCPECQQVTCQAHAGHHNCTNPPENKTVPQCPVCEKHLFVRAKDSLDAIVGEHIDSGCSAHLLKDHMKQRKKRTKRCPVKGCKGKLLFAVECGQCSQQFCPKHRFPDSHECLPSSCASQHRRASPVSSSSLGSSLAAAVNQRVNTIRAHWQRRYPPAVKG